jgi:S-adenosylmethionine/arginine decarboxylase-like enzyme
MRVWDVSTAASVDVVSCGSKSVPRAAAVVSSARQLRRIRRYSETVSALRIRSPTLGEGLVGGGRISIGGI